MIQSMNRQLLIPALLVAAATTLRAEDAERIGDAWHDARNPIVKIFAGERLDLWSLQPIQRTTPPEIQAGRNAIDRFIVQKLAAAGKQLSPEADRWILGRRLYFDLTGLPPTHEQLQRFVDDARTDAYERLVEELLASPAYGEHAARLWLDVVRYSDSNGFDWDEFRPQAWRFRDYVIRSFNADKPYDQFVREQLAGDELLDGPPRTPAEQDLLIATTYLRLGPHDNAAGLFNEQARSRHELLVDLVETTGSAFLGMTMACCRCHDHKTDPLSQADHYRLRAFFEPVQFADDVPLNLVEEQEAINKRNAVLNEKIGGLEKQREALKTAVRDRLKASKPEPKDDEIQAAYSEKEKQQDQKHDAEINNLRKQQCSFETGLLMTDSGGDVPTTHVLYQGDYRATRQAVLPGFLSAIDPNPSALSPAVNKRTKGRRLTLANWIVSAENPLAARVIVNRLWQQHFGRGLVTTSNDFGLAGACPKHPELLDFLASDLRDNGWSLKRLHRLIVTSATYRQASVRTANDRDADKLYSRQTLRRLTAEQLRDAVLSVSGLLTPKEGGSPVWPELPAEVLQANPAFFDDNATRTKGWYPSPANQQHVRSVYLVQKRTVRVPLMETFDLPENSVSCARRTNSIVAPQALSLLNSPLAVEASKAFAERVERETEKTPADQVRKAFQLGLQREPNEKERVACENLLKERGLVELCRVVLNLNEFIYID